MRAVNLLPGDDAGDGGKVPQVPVIAGCVASVFVVALLALSYLSASHKVATQQQALATLQSQSAAIPAPPPPSPVITQLPQQEKARVAALATALGQRIVWDRLLREISQVVPSDVWIVTLEAKSPLLAVTNARNAPMPNSTLPDGFIAQGCTYSQDSVARFLARLQLVPDLGDVTLGKSASDQSESNDATLCPSGMFTFKLNGNLRVTSGAAS
jgi:Tfp pilus assembly protein PilN